MSSALPFSAPAERNKEAILAELARLLPASVGVLEIASGTGQHAAHFAAARSGWTWQPTDADAAMLAAIDARCATLANVRPARVLDVLGEPWPTLPPACGAIYCANMLHIAPWSTCPALMHGSAAVLGASGLLLLYGPYRQQGVTTAPSNEAFDLDLKARNPAWGLRTLSAVEHEAAAVGLTLEEVVAMPANNLLLAFRR